MVWAFRKRLDREGWRTGSRRCPGPTARVAAGTRRLKWYLAVPTSYGTMGYQTSNFVMKSKPLPSAPRPNPKKSSENPNVENLGLHPLAAKALSRKETESKWPNLY